MHFGHSIRGLAFASILALSAQAHAVVESGHIGSSTGSNGVGDSNFSVSIDQTFTGDITGVFLKYTNGALSGVSYNVDEGADVFVVQPGSVFSNASIAGNQTPFIYGVSTESHLPTSTVNVGQDFYLGVRTRSYTDPGFAEAANAGTLSTYFTTFGWAHFKVDASGLPKLIGSAVALNEGGIIVGSLQAVPEPSSLALMGTGLAALAWRARRRVARQG